MQLSAGRRIRLQITQNELNPGEEETSHVGRREDRGVVAQDTEEDAAFAVATDPAYGVIGVGTDTWARARTALVHVGLLDVQAQQDVQFVARIRRVREAEELVLIKEFLACERG